MSKTQTYDYIIAGGGMAGLSLAYYLDCSELRNKKILIIDREPKTTNDRTWAFWQYGQGAFESIVSQRWQGLWVYGPDIERFIELTDYQYKKIQGIDFYNFVLPKLHANPNISFVFSPIQVIADNYVQTEAGRFEAKYIFDSTYQLNLNLPHKHNLLQHFKGWVIKTKTPSFDPAKPTIMDFRVDQVDDHCTFFYVLPSSSTEALVEYTLFSPAVFSPETYATALHNYLRDYLNITEYEIIHQEYGVIPMTDEDTPEHINPHLIRIGTSGGYTKGSTGYTFERTQNYLQEIVENLTNFGEPFRWKEPLKARYKWFDSVLLNVLVKKRATAREIFLRLYTRNNPDFIFSFLGERSTLWQEIKMMTTFPIIPFIKGAIEVTFRNKSR
jgi:lycopene beta-cyclase